MANEMDGNVEETKVNEFIIGHLYFTPQTVGAEVINRLHCTSEFDANEIPPYLNTLKVQRSKNPPESFALPIADFPMPSFTLDIEVDLFEKRIVSLEVWEYIGKDLV